ncbi:aspartate-semialdehyde dehydrogenase [Candidatus Uzinura diaspidicola str. ASNER]|uniref:Aspartate-semialdehyde dehydrogenase n=1 Tax=Candidatus Uzinura diaspidicola str. ASNER TaxID=1133592 RepID=L7VJR7_9FLAO|nr:aspartate-semialdehyde dehydrogenase [Candidatus Uzinura diaspidicola str. ASNER]
MRVAIIGVTGLVGGLILRVLEDRKFHIKELLAVSSALSLGKEIFYQDKKHILIDLEQAICLSPEIAFFTAKEEISKKWAPIFATRGSIVIDNSSAFRMISKIKLIVPEINAHILSKKDKIIANPNCSTIQLVIILHTLHKKYIINRVVISTYQSITGTGKKSIDQLIADSQGISTERIYPHPIYQNSLPQCDLLDEKGYTKEELKLIKETIKIMDVDSMKITATSVRIPVIGGHSESVNITFEKYFNLEDLKSLLSKTSGIRVQDDLLENHYPMPITSHDKDEVFVGRLRRDFSYEKAINAWIVADNLRKGAATNAVQIAEYLVENF